LERENSLKPLPSHRKYCKSHLVIVHRKERYLPASEKRIGTGKDKKLQAPSYGFSGLSDFA